MQNSELNMDAEWYYRRALVWLAQEKIAEAILDLETAVSIDPSHAPAWVVLGTCYLYDQRCLCVVSRCCWQGLALGLDNPKHYTTLAHHLSQTLLEDLAITTLEKGLERFPDDVQIRHAIVDHYREEGDWMRTALHLEALTQRFPDRHDYWVNLALTYLSIDFFPEASEAADWAIFLNPNDGWSYLVKGFTYMPLPGGLFHAVPMFSEAAKLAPGLPIAQTMLFATQQQVQLVAQTN